MPDMTLNQIKRLNQKAAKQYRAQLFTEWRSTVEAADHDGRNLTAEERASVDDVKAKLEAVDARLESLEARGGTDVDKSALKAALSNGGGAVARGELRSEGVYRTPDDRDARGKPGYFHDMYLAHVGAAGAAEARERLNQNHNQWLAEVEQRSGISTDSSHHGSDFAPALWQAPQFDYVQLLRNGRPFLNWYGPQELPLGISPQLLRPQVTGGASVTEMSAEGASVSNTDPTTATEQLNIGTLSGLSVASVQMLELGPVGDRWITTDLNAAYDTAAEGMALNGTATNRKGISKVGSTSTLTTTALSFFDIVLQASYLITGAAPGLQADYVLTTPAFWQSFLSQMNTDHRPDYATGDGDGFNVRAKLSANPAGLGHVGDVFGIPVIVSNNVTNDLAGDATHWSGIYVAARQAFSILESPARIRVADQVGVANARVSFLQYGYMALYSDYPKGIVQTTGTGNLPASGYHA